MFEGLPLLSLVIFLPLAGALLIAFLPRENLVLIRGAALATALATFAAALLLLAGFNAAEPGFQFREEADWIPAFGIQYKLGADGISLALVVLTTAGGSLELRVLRRRLGWSKANTSEVADTLHLCTAESVSGVTHLCVSGI
jgi:NADH:ubiquinone oxidoreductase subunit 4 (subunit M)